MKKKDFKNIKVLHIGNIANNAFLNSKFLREEKIQSDVICYDYYHIMGCPEWEECEIQGLYGNDFSPDWSKEDLKEYQRPSWFLQGSLEEIAFKNFGQKNRKDSEKDGEPTSTEKRSILNYLIYGLSLLSSRFYKIYLEKFYQPNKVLLIFFSLIGKILSIFFSLLIRYLVWARIQLLDKEERKIFDDERKYAKLLIKDFKYYFPDRNDQLKMSDISFFLYRTRVFKKIFQNYDIVQCYATDPIYAMLAGKRPYIAFEHGTLRDIPFEKSAVGRLTALAYRKADLVFLTNSDSIKAVKKLGIKNYVVTPHPLDDYWHKKYSYLTKEKKKNYILFCPARHDWKIKGIDLYIQALPEITKIIPEVKLIFLEWGMDVLESKELIKKLKVEGSVQWLQPLPRHKLAYWLAKADIVLDQLILPAMGGIAPEAMQAGKPLLMSYKHDVSKWMFAEQPPLVLTYTKEDIIKNIIKLHKNPKLAKKIGKEGQDWFKKYYSKQVVKNILIENYRKLFNKYRYR
jgi:glycosyltransferase involved in cell wall biosynthesis